MFSWFFVGFDQNKEFISKKCVIIFRAQCRLKVQIYFEFVQNRICGLDWSWLRTSIYKPFWKITFLSLGYRKTDISTEMWKKHLWTTV